MPIFFNCAMIGWSVMWGGLTLRSSAAYAKNLLGGHRVDLNLGRCLHVDGRLDLRSTRCAGLPNCESGVTL
jgi:hypothetical protein